MSSPPKPAAIASLGVHYSVVRVALFSALVLLALGWSAWWIVAAVASRHGLVVIVGAGGLLLGVFVAFLAVPAMVHAWRHRGPVVVIDEDGVTDVRKKVDFIGWPDVKEVTLGAGHTARFLCFTFRRPDPARVDPPRVPFLGWLMRGVRFLGDWNVDMRLLACSRREVLDRADAMMKRSMRQRVAELNKDNRHGWSGTL